MPYTSDCFTIIGNPSKSIHYRNNYYCSTVHIVVVVLQTFRGDFYDFCIPLIDTHEPTFNNFTCTFLASEGNMYYIEHTSTTWNENKCCLFQAVSWALYYVWILLQLVLLGNSLFMYVHKYIASVLRWTCWLENRQSGRKFNAIYSIFSMRNVNIGDRTIIANTSLIVCKLFSHLVKLKKAVSLALHLGDCNIMLQLF